jgi:O-antigen ligase
MALPPEPREAVARFAAVGCAVLLLAHPALYEQRSAYGAVAVGLGLVWAGSLAWSWPGWSDLRPPRCLLWPATVFALGVSMSVAVNGVDWGPLWQLATQLLFLWLGWWLAADERAVRFLGMSVLLGGSLAGFYGLVQYAGLDPLPEVTRFTDRIVSFFDNPNHFANYMALLLPLGLAGYLRQSRPRGPFWAWYGLVGVLYAGLVMAASRSAWAAAVFGGLVVLVGYARSVRRHQLAWRPLSAALLLGLLLAVTCLLSLRPVLRGPSGPVSLGERALSSANIVGPGAYLDSTIRHRYFLWRVTWEMIRARPLTGFGYGRYQAQYAAFRDAHRTEEGFRRLSWAQRQEVTPYAHNEYLHLWAESGLVGLIGFALLLAAGLGRGLVRALASDREALVGWGLLGSAAAMLVDSLASYPLHLPLNGMVFWISFGIIYRVSSFSDNRGISSVSL